MYKERLLSKYESVFPRSEELLYYFSPGRINVIGEHIDYNGGLVFPCAISLGTYAIVSLRNDKVVSVYSESIPQTGVVSFDLTSQLEKDNNWVDYVKGVIDEIKKLGCKVYQGFNAYIYGDLPKGASVSSSASLELLFVYCKIANTSCNSAVLIFICSSLSATLILAFSTFFSFSSIVLFAVIIAFLFELIDACALAVTLLFSFAFASNAATSFLYCFNVLALTGAPNGTTLINVKQIISKNI